MNKLLGIALILFWSMECSYAQSDEAEKYVQQGIEFYDKGDFREAIDQYKEALKLDEMSPRANYEIAFTYFTLKDYDSAVLHSEKVIRAKSKYIDQAYIIYGSAMDMKGESQAAIGIYKKALKEFPKNNLLHYNLAYTYYNLKSYKDSEKELIEALKINPSHGSSQLLLGYLMDDQNRRVKSLLAIYNFLLIEPEGDRATAAYELLTALLVKGVTRDSEKSTTITMDNSSRETDEFRAADLMISMLEASKNTGENKKKTESELFYENTKSFFTVLGELKKNNKGFWWNFYVDFFYAMTRDPNNVETYCYYISQANKDKSVTEWLENNKDKYERFTKWYSEFQRKH